MSSPHNSTLVRRRMLAASRTQRTAREALRPVLHLMKRSNPREDIDSAAIGLTMLWLADDVIAAVNRRLDRVGLSEKKLDVLMIFADQNTTAEPEQTMKQTPGGVADYFGISKASATGLLDWLEKRGLVARSRHTKDRRSTPIAITAEGQSLVSEAVPVFEAACRDLVATLTDRDRKDLQRILNKLWTHLKDEDFWLPTDK